MAVCSASDLCNFLVYYNKKINSYNIQITIYYSLFMRRVEVQFNKGYRLTKIPQKFNLYCFRIWLKIYEQNQGWLICIICIKSGENKGMLVFWLWYPILNFSRFSYSNRKSMFLEQHYSGKRKFFSTIVFHLCSSKRLEHYTIYPSMYSI